MTSGVTPMFTDHFRRGLAAAAPATGQLPDMLVDYRVILQERTEVTGGPVWNGIQTYNYLKGTITVMLTDPKDGLVLWRGVAEGTVPSIAGARARTARSRSRCRRCSRRSRTRRAGSGARALDRIG
jgi:hypothetical protein